MNIETTTTPANEFSCSWIRGDTREENRDIHGIIVALALASCVVDILFRRAFRHLEPNEEYKNSTAYLFLAVIWLLSVKKLKTSLLVRRAKIWGGAAVVCVTASLTGLMVFVVYPLGWAFWFVFFPSLLVLALTLPDRSTGSTLQHPPTSTVST